MPVVLAELGGRVLFYRPTTPVKLAGPFHHFMASKERSNASCSKVQRYDMTVLPLRLL
jgi:hypothetical protein